ncbi:transcription factor RFX4-like isoform X2 [Amblyomma americanum]
MPLAPATTSGSKRPCFDGANDQHRLQENYEVAEGVCIPRNTLYLHYVDFCARNAMQPVNAASFGKIIRQQFPQLTTRRLGTRGQSRYHYYGIAVRVGSRYFEPPYAKGGDAATGCSRQWRQCSPPPVAASTLPEFPRVRELLLPAGADGEQLSAFVAMYRGHCQRLLDECSGPALQQEPPLAGLLHYVAHFWRRVPAHLAPLLASNALANLVGICDSLLYGALADALLPLQPPPADSVCRGARLLAEQLEPWLDAALAGFPAPLRAIKLHMCRCLSQALRRRLSLAKMTQAWRAAVATGAPHDWALLDLATLSRQAAAQSPRPGTPSARFLYARTQELSLLLLEGGEPASLLGWLEALVERSVAAPSAADGPRLAASLARHFLAVWGAAGTEAERQLASSSSTSLRPLRALLDEWARALVERLLCDALVRQLLANVASDAPPDLTECWHGCADALMIEPAAYT